jgi:predicted dehydrogenase
MSDRTHRRRFLQVTAATGLGAVFAGVDAHAGHHKEVPSYFVSDRQPKESRSPNEKIAFASIGLGGKGSSDSVDAGTAGNMVAICDVDQGTLNAGKNRFSKAKAFTDFRKMLDDMGKSIDAVTVSTPDHMHAPAALMAMRMGKHCFCQKPLAHTIYEANLMAKVASEMKVATQMGNQGTAEPKLRRAAAIIQSGVLGNVSEVHIWCNRPVWAQGGNRPKAVKTPTTIDWNLWLGVAPTRPFGVGYHPFAWRGWWDFGTGALGDMACHSVNMPYMALKFRDPLSVQADCSGHNGDSYPKWSVITFEFPATNGRGPIKMVWYDGGKRPSNDLIDGKVMDSSGCVVIGDKGRLYSPGDYAEKEIYLLGGPQMPEVNPIVSPGHFAEWVHAIQGGEPATSNFPNYAGKLTEITLLGNLAIWVAATGKGEKLLWDAQNLRCTNIAGLETLIKPIYRPGYTLDV